MRRTGLFAFSFTLAALLASGCEPAALQPTATSPTTASPQAVSTSSPVELPTQTLSKPPTSTSTSKAEKPPKFTSTAPPTTPTQTFAPSLLGSAAPNAGGQVIGPGMPAPGIWVSAHARQGSRFWIQFEVYYRDGQPFIDVLEACAHYSCEAQGENFEAKGCAGDKSPRSIPLVNGKLQIDFKNIMPETVTRGSKLGSIHARFPEPQVIDGVWIIPACDLWIKLEVEFKGEAPAAMDLNP